MARQIVIKNVAKERREVYWVLEVTKISHDESSAAASDEEAARRRDRYGA